MKFSKLFTTVFYLDFSFSNNSWVFNYLNLIVKVITLVLIICVRFSKNLLI